MSEFGSDLIQSLSEAVAHAKGNGHAILHGPMTPRSVREQVKLTQAQMASLMGMSLSGYRKWEQGTRRVSGPTAVLLRVIEKEWSREPGVSEAVEQDRPNLFDYATKELSQDAMVCWLLKWSEHRYQSQHRALHNCGVRFVRELLQMHGASLGNEIEKMEIYRQEQHIDVLARVNNEHVLLIEDKTDTKDRGNQLEKCYQAVVRGKTRLGKVDDSLLHPIYLQTGNQPLADDHRIEKIKGYKVFNRKDFLNVLDSYEGSDSTLTDFKRHLQRLESLTNSYTEWKGGKRDQWHAWEGFYQRLESEFSDKHTLGWNYVPFPGNFLGFWWSPSKSRGNLYLQIEAKPGKEAKLCFKVNVGRESKEQRKPLRDYWRIRVMAAGGQKVKSSGRLGKCMTLACWKEGWLSFGEDGRLDISSTVENLRQAEMVLLNAINDERTALRGGPSGAP